MVLCCAANSSDLGSKYVLEMCAVAVQQRLVGNYIVHEVFNEEKTEKLMIHPSVFTYCKPRPWHLIIYPQIIELLSSGTSS